MISLIAFFVLVNVFFGVMGEMDVAFKSIARHAVDLRQGVQIEQRKKW